MAASSKLIRSVLVVKPSSIIRSTTLFAPDFASSSLSSARTLNTRSRKPSAPALKGTPRSNTHFRNSVCFHQNFPFPLDGPSRGEQRTQFSQLQASLPDPLLLSTPMITTDRGAIVL